MFTDLTSLKREPGTWKMDAGEMLLIQASGPVSSVSPVAM